MIGLSSTGDRPGEGGVAWVSAGMVSSKRQGSVFTAESYGRATGCAMPASLGEFSGLT